MCGRFTQTRDPRELSRTFDVPDVPADLRPRYNVAPGQGIAAVGLKPDGTRRGLAVLRWGFVPRWAADPDGGPRPINAKAETVATSPAFRDSFRDRRCLIPADGFYEWAAAGGRKHPVHFRLRGGGLFALAGVWDVWRRPGRDPVRTCAVLTVPANDEVRPVHARMPAVLLPDRFAAWLDPRATPDDLAGLLVPLPAGLLDAVPVGPAVNRVTNDGPDCLAPAAGLLSAGGRPELPFHAEVGQ